MLVLTRKLNTEVRLGADIVIRVLEIHGNSVRLGLEAPADLIIWRPDAKTLLHPPPARVQHSPTE